MPEGTPPKNSFNMRAFASLALLCSLAWLVPSGVLMHFAVQDGLERWGHLLMSIHNTASLVFVAVAVTHLSLNWKAVSRYVRSKTGEYAPLKREVFIAFIGVSGLVAFIASHALLVQ